MQHTQVVSFLWGVADLIRDTFKRGKYQDVILPLTVLRRLDCVLAPTKQAVLQANAEYKDKLDDLSDLLTGRSVGYEINFNRYFYVYQPPRPLEEIEAEIREIEKEIVEGLAALTGGVGR